jgi:CheY-like chemotaxis protein
MPEGGAIAVTAENVTLGAEDKSPLKGGRYVLISIKDQGTGISGEHLKKIFDPYFTTKQKGSGLGLSSVYSIIKNHEGHIEVESKLEVGTTFHIYLPASEKKLPATGGMSEKIIKGTGSVLVMDDEELIRNVVGEILAILGYETAFARDGAEALKLYRKALEAGSPFAAVIMDLTIPGGMGGKEAIKRLLETDPGAIVIVSSGYSNDPIMADYKLYGFSGVIAKPYKIEELGEKLHALLGKG